MRRIYIAFMILATLSMFTSCEMGEERLESVKIESGASHKISSAISPSCVVESRSVSRAESAGISVRSLVDQITTKRMESNFLRLDEDLNASNDGLYTFTGNETSTPYATNWNRALLLESIVTSSPDNTEGIHYRSVSLAPEQSYKLNIIEEKIDGVVHRDTTHFYHTRMVGWYPMTCTLPRREGVPATAQFDFSDFDAVRLNETVEINGVPTEVVALQFTGFDGETDLMVSNVCEGQSWHKYNSTTPHKSDIHPMDNSNIYREPFGHNFTSPSYSNYFTYRHYRSAIRVTAYAEQSPQNLSMWGEIERVIIRNQPTSCKVWLPTHLGEFGEVYHWGDYKNLPIVTTPMFDNDSNYPDYNQSATYPIYMNGSSSENDIYLGYSLVEPNRDVELEIHTSSGIYTTKILTKHPVKDADGNEGVVDIFEAGYIYEVKLNLKTDGTIAAILENEGDERYYDLSSLHEFEVGEVVDKDAISTFKLANCYVVAPNELKDENGNEDISLDLLTRKDGRYEALKAYEKFVKPEYVLTGSNTSDHTFMQTEFLYGNCAMMVSGSWLSNEMEESGGAENFVMMKLPVISSITDNLETVKKESQLRKVITAVDNVTDGNKSVDDYKQGDNYVIDDITVSASDWEAVRKARNTMAANHSGDSAYIPSYSNAKEGAKEFLKYLYSDEGIQIYSEALKVVLPLTNEVLEKVDTSDWNDFEKSQVDLLKTTEQFATYYNRQKHSLFINGGASSYGARQYISYLCNRNEGDRKSADEVWTSIVGYMEGQYDGWLSNIK